MKKLILASTLLLVATQIHAESAHVMACVKWWGGDIPVEERTQENCPTGTNHWDMSRKTELGASAPTHTQSLIPGENFYGTSKPAITGNLYILPNAGYQVIRNGSTTTVIQTSKSR